MKIQRHLLAFVLAIFGWQEAKAQLIGIYGFGGAAGTEATLPPNSQPTNGQLSSIKRGSGLLPNDAANAFGASGFTLNAEPDTADYFEFALKANSGFALNLDSVVVSERRSNTGIRKFAVRTSLDNFGANVASFDVPDDNQFRNNQKVVLGSAFQNVASGTTVRFRYYGFSSEAVAGSWRLDSIRVYGSIEASGPQNPIIRFQNPSGSLTEGDSLIYGINSSELTTAVFSIVRKSGSAIASDYSLNAPVENVQFPFGSTLTTRQVKAIKDGITEGTESVVFVLRTQAPNLTIGSDSLFTLTINDPSPVVTEPYPFTRTIAQVRGANTDGAADSVGHNVRLYGTVYGVNQRLTSTGGGYQLFIRDATGGIGIFKNAPVNGITTLNEGDSVKVMGKIEVFRGLSQINPDSMVVLATGRSLKTPTVATKVDEPKEGDLLRINNVHLVSAAAWTGTGTGFTVKVTNGTDTVDVRIDNDCPLYSQPAPTGSFDIIGMGGQFTAGTTAPWVGGYQLIPRKTADLIPVVTNTPVISFVPATRSVSEQAGLVAIEASISSAPTSDISVRLVLKSSTATSGSDFLPFANTTLLFPAGSTIAQSSLVTITDDLLVENTENLIFALRPVAAPIGFSVGADSLLTLSILDNDSPVVPEPYPFTRTIAQVRGINTDGGADSVGHNVRLYGTVYGVNQRLTSTGGGYQMFIRDATGGIGIFKNAPVNGITTLNEGDSVKVMGKIEVFRGLSQINPDSMVVLATGRSLKTPTVATRVDEQKEGNLLRINNVHLVNAAAWTGTGTGFTVKVTNGTDTVDVRIDNDCPLYSQPAPTGNFDIVGMGGQFTAGTTSPWVGGYQLIPRRVTDLIGLPSCGFAVSTQSVAENGDTIRVVVNINPAPTSELKILVETKSQSAVLGTDYSLLGINTLFFPPNTTSQTYKLKLVDDAVVDGNKNIVFALRNSPGSSVPNAAISSDSLHTVTIVDNDSPVVTEPYPFTRSIAQVRGANTDGAADSVGHNVRLYGTVYGVNQRLTSTGGGYQMFIRDATGGIGIFKNAPVNGITTLNEGDSVKVMGKIEVFRGLSQINPDSMVVLATGRSLKTPTVATKVDEPKEGDLVQINNVHLVSAAAWTGTGTGFTVKVTNGTDTVDVRIDNDCPLYSQPAPTGTFDIIGMGGQFTAGITAPWVGGYQLIPRRVSDLIPITLNTSVFNFAPASKTVLENAVSVVITVSTPVAPINDVTLNVLVKGGTATAGSDYQPLSIGTLTFTSGIGTTQTFNLSVLDDALVESAETVTIVIRPQGAATGFSIGADSVFTLTITDNDGTVTEPYPFTRTIAQIRGANTDGAADSVGHNVRLYGTIYGLNQRITNGAGYQMFIRDATGGIGIFKSTFINGITALNEGDSVKVMGKIEVFRGLSQINPDSMVVLATGRSLKTPTIVTAITEPNEADLLRFNNATLVSAAAWTGTGTGFTVQVTDGTNTLDVRIDNDCPLYSQPAPTGPFDIIGMGGQFTSTTTAPWVGGYQLIPRRVSDLIPVTAVDPLCQCELNLKAYPNPGTYQLVLETKIKTNFTYQVFNQLGKRIWEKRAPGASETIETAVWAPGVYTVRVVETGHTIRWVKK